VAAELYNSGKPLRIGPFADFRERLAHRLAAVGQAVSPWWRFRLWARLAGPSAYASHPDSAEQLRRVWPHDSI